MSIDFEILCRVHPDIRASQSTWLTWNDSDGTGRFAGMSLRLRTGPPDAIVNLPDPSWAKTVVATIHAAGRLNDETCDDFADWMKDVARQSQGALFDFQAGKLTYIWSDEAGTIARVRSLLGTRDFDVVAGLIRETQERRHVTSEYETIVDEVWPALEALVRQGDAIAVLLAFQAGISSRADSMSPALDDATLAAAQIPALRGNTQLQQVAVQAEGRRVERAVEERANPTAPADLAVLLDDVASGDAVAIGVLHRMAVNAPTTLTTVRAMIIDLARSGRAVSPAGIAALVIYRSAFSLDDPAARAELAGCGELGKAIAAAHEASTQAEIDKRAEYQRTLERQRAANAKLLWKAKRK